MRGLGPVKGSSLVYPEGSLLSSPELLSGFPEEGGAQSLILRKGGRGATEPFREIRPYIYGAPCYQMFEHPPTAEKALK